ncbi:MAG: DUF2460 domain-containing protein [Asticcacaulis sp.]
MGFHDVRFPARLAFGSGAGIERKVQIVSLASGFEQRISPWGLGRRRYLIGAGIRSLSDAAALLAFFEARQGPLYGFRFRDFADCRSGDLKAAVTAQDQVIGVGDGQNKVFQLVKAYGDVRRPITKPVEGTVVVAVSGVAAGFSVDVATGLVTLTTAPALGASVTAGFEFDTPVRFDSDRLDMTLEGFEAGRVAAVPLIEIRV